MNLFPNLILDLKSFIVRDFQSQNLMVKVKEVNDQETTQSEKNSHSKN